MTWSNLDPKQHDFISPSRTKAQPKPVSALITASMPNLRPSGPPLVYESPGGDSDSRSRRARGPLARAAAMKTDRASHKQQQKQRLHLKLGRSVVFCAIKGEVGHSRRGPCSH